MLAILLILPSLALTRFELHTDSGTGLFIYVWLVQFGLHRACLDVWVGPSGLECYVAVSFVSGIWDDAWPE